MQRIASLINRIIADFYIRDPKIKNILDIQLPTVALQIAQAKNEVAYLLRMEKIDNLNTVDFELTNNCNLRCVMCPVNTGPMTRRKGYMEFGLFQKIIDSNPQLKRIRFTLWGEPLLHPELFKFIDYARKHSGAYLLIYTNGTLLNDELSRKIIDSGLDMVCFSIDGRGRDYEKIRGFKYGEIQKKVRDFIELKNNLKPKIKTNILAVGLSGLERDMEGFLSEWKNIGADFIEIVSQTMYMDKKPTNLTKACRFLWRGYLAIAWNGDISACCTDHNFLLNLGNLKDFDFRLGKVINSKEICFLRSLHIKKQFPKPCNTCYEYASKGVAKRFTI